jgi:methionyl-tRNA formyltransferase
MCKTSGTLHIFGGGEFVGIAEKIANKLGWSVVVRTGDRFTKSIPDLNARTKLLVGDDLLSLMTEGGLPKHGDYGISFSAPWIFSQEVIDMFDGDIFNLHNQPLPKFRGGGGASWLILMGERLGGCCIHRLARKIDAGDIFARRDFCFPGSLEYPIDYDRYVIDHAKELLIQWLPRLLDDRSPGDVIYIDESESEYWPRINTEIHGWIDWSWGLEDILSFCNAFSYPHPGARTLINGCVIEIKEVTIFLNKKFHPYQNGMIFRVSNGIYVAHRDGVLHISDYQISDFQVKINLGDRLFTPKDLLEKAMLQRVQYLPSGKVVGLR